MADPNQVKVSYIAEITDLKKKLSEIPGQTASQARAAVKDLDNAIRQANKLQEQAIKNASKNGANSAKIVQTQISQAKEGVASLGSALSVISPEAGAVVAQLGALSGAAKAAATAAAGMGVSLGAVMAALGPIAIAAAALGAAWMITSRETELATALMATQRAAAKSLEPATRALEDATLDLAVATGVMSQEQEKSIRLSMAAQRAVLDLAAAQATQRSDLRETVASNKAHLATLKKVQSAMEWTPAGAVLGWVGYNDALTSGIDKLAGWSDKAENASAQEAALDSALTQEAETQRTLRAVKEATAKATQRNTEATQRNTEATKEDTEATKAAEEAQRALQARLSAIETAQTSLADITESAYQRTLGPAELLARQQELELQRLGEIAMASEDAAMARIAYEEVSRAQSQDTAEFQAKLTAERIKADEEAAQKAIDLRRRQQEAMASALAGAFGGMADLAEFAVERLEGTGPAAVAAFAAWKAFSYAAAVVQGLQAAVSAYAATVVIPVVGPILAPIAAATAVAATGLSIAKIAATEMPTYHQGGIVDFASDEIPATLTRRESVLTAQGTDSAGGREGVARLNRGQPLQPLIVQMRYKHRIFTEFFEDFEKSQPPKPAIRPGRRF